MAFGIVLWPVWRGRHGTWSGLLRSRLLLLTSPLLPQPAEEDEIESAEESEPAEDSALESEA